MRAIFITVLLLASVTIAFVWRHWIRSSQTTASSDLEHARQHNAKTRLVIGVLIMLFLLPVVGIGWRQSLQAMFNNPKQWMPASSEARRAFAQFELEFSEIDTIFISWPGCTVEDVRLSQLSQELIGSTDPARRIHCATYFLRVSNGYDLLRELTTPPQSLGRSDALSRLRGALVGPDGKTSCAAVELGRSGDDRRTDALALLLEVAADVCQLSEDQFYLAGTPIDGVRIDQESLRSIDLFGLPSNVIVLLLCRWFLRSWRFTLIVFSIAIFGQTAGLALVHYTGQQMNALYVVMPPLVMVLTVSAAVHLVNYYYDEVELGSPGAAARALSHAWTPCLLAASTTILGLLSLTGSAIRPLIFFGLFSALSLAISISLLFLMLPAAMEWQAVDSRPAEPPTASGFNDRNRWQWRWASQVCQYRRWIVVSCSLLICIACYGLKSLDTSVNVRSLFRPSSRIRQDYAWFEENLGPTVPVEVVIRFQRECELGRLAQLRLIREIEEQIAVMDAVGSVVSAQTFAADLTPRISGLRPSQLIRVQRQFTEFERRAKDAHYLHQDQQGQSWRITARVAALQDIDYQLFLERIRARVTPLVAKHLGQEAPDTISVSYTGAMPLAYATQRALLQDLCRSFGAALILITLVMIVHLRSVVAGLVVMVPNLFPTLIMFGFVSLYGLPLDIGSIMTASVALGIAVDDTLHFLSSFQRELAQCGDRTEAVCRAYRRCAAAMVQTTVICGLGLLVYGLSTFVPTRRFAWMVVALLMTALAGDLILLPALLAGPVGKLLGTKAAETKNAKTSYLLATK